MVPRETSLSRRGWLAGSALSAGSILCVPAMSIAASPDPPPARWRYCFNTSTVRGQNLSLPEQVDLAARAGYDGIEPWLREIEQYVQAGGSLADLRKRIADRGLIVESAIGFANWIVDDDARRAAGLEQARRDMDIVRQIGGTRLAAPPAGAQQERIADLPLIARRYRDLLVLGEELGVVPLLELWGFSATLRTLSEVAFVAIEARHPQAALLLDIYHLHKGGSDFGSLRLLHGAALPVLHTNDYPADPPRLSLTVAHRVYPGDGVAPLDSIFRTLQSIGFAGALSLELFHRELWQQDPLLVARTGLEKTKAAVAKALGR